MLTHLDLFSGIGGFALAAEWAGFTTIGFSEIEPYACKILKRHWPHVPNYGDIGNVPSLSADLVTGGPPCQPASVAGHRKGAKDDRWLWPQALDCVERIRPTFCLFENPTGILTLNGGVEFERVLSRLESLGYAVQPIVIPAVGVDARHRRERVWIVAHAKHGRLPVGRGIEAVIGNGRNTFGIPSHVQTLKQQQAEQVLADSNTLHVERRNDSSAQNRQESGERQAGFQGSGGGRWAEWLPEPSVGRVAHGIPDRAHRLRGLGNAIVPQVAAEIIRAMIAKQ